MASREPQDAQGPVPDLMIVGGFTTPRRNARGEGLQVFRAAPGSETWSPVFHLGGLVNPSFLIADPQRPVVYAVHGDCDYASSFAIDRSSGALRPLGQAATGGVNGVHLALDPSGRFLIVANYASGSVSILPVRADGTLEAFCDRLPLPGETGPHRSEQTLSHPHHVVFDPEGRFILVPDKGLDRVFVLTFDSPAGRLGLVSETRFRPGAGPRHLVFHPTLSIVFVVNELESTVAICLWDRATGILTPHAQVPALPPDFFGASTAAAIVVSPDGHFIFASHRGHDSFVRFAFDAETLSLSAMDWTATGRDPRFMTLDPSGRALLVANEQSDTIQRYSLPVAENGPLMAGESIAVKSPSAMIFV